MNQIEDTQKPPLHKRSFVQHIGRNIAIGLSLSAISLLGGMWGYHHFEKMPWIEAYVNAAMILSGMGPVDPLKTEGGKLFAGSYALFSGIFFLFIVAIIFAPVTRRFLKKLHVEEEKAKKEP